MANFTRLMGNPSRYRWCFGWKFELLPPYVGSTSLDICRQTRQHSWSQGLVVYCVIHNDLQVAEANLDVAESQTIPKDGRETVREAHMQANEKSPNMYHDEDFWVGEYFEGM
jgi:hypothetical protein